MSTIATKDGTAVSCRDWGSGQPVVFGQIVPIGASSFLAAKLVPSAVRKIYPGGFHGLGDMSKAQLKSDLLAFLKP